jgi:hypothetical protein
MKRMTIAEKAIFMKKWHGDTALIQAKQCLAFNDFSEYWMKVVDVLEKKQL